jgi:hypothetical protein
MPRKGHLLKSNFSQVQWIYRKISLIWRVNEQGLGGRCRRNGHGQAARLTSSTAEQLGPWGSVTTQSP